MISERKRLSEEREEIKAFLRPFGLELVGWNTVTNFTARIETNNGYHYIEFIPELVTAFTQALDNERTKGYNQACEDQEHMIAGEIQPK